MLNAQLELNAPALAQIFQNAEIISEPPVEAQALDLEMFSQLYQNYVERIHHYIQYRLGDGENAEDLTSLVFLKAWEKRDHFKQTGAPFIAWLYTIARNTMIDSHRGYKETIPLDEDGNFESEGESPSESYEHQVESQTLRAALSTLTNEQFQVIRWKFFDGMSTEEIARRMDKKEGTVRALQMRALKKLCEEMRKNDAAASQNERSHR